MTGRSGNGQTCQMFLLCLKLDIHSLSCGGGVNNSLTHWRCRSDFSEVAGGTSKSLSRPSRIRLRSLTRSFAGRSVGLGILSFHLVFERESSRSRIPFIIYQTEKVRISSDRTYSAPSLCWRDGKDDKTRLGGRMGKKNMWRERAKQSRRNLKSKPHLSVAH